MGIQITGKQYNYHRPTDVSKLSGIGPRVNGRGDKGIGSPKGTTF